MLECGPKIRLQEGAYIDTLSLGGVKIVERALSGRNCCVECTGSLLRFRRDLVIGRDTTFGLDCLFGVAGGIEIGEDVMAGQHVRIHLKNHRFDNPDISLREQGVTQKGIRIVDGCRIGVGAVLLDRSVLGEGCVVAANATVTKIFPSRSILSDVPAIVIGKQTRGRAFGDGAKQG